MIPVVQYGRVSSETVVSSCGVGELEARHGSDGTVKVELKNTIIGRTLEV
jgi:hypothetical protein